MTNPELIPGDVVVCRNATHMFIGCGGEPNSFGFMKLWFLSLSGTVWWTWPSDPPNIDNRHFKFSYVKQVLISSLHTNDTNE